jgi:ATP-dependent Clp protease adaptor protein ClpS
MSFKENTKTVEKTGLKKPQMYRVLFYNDDFTPMDFVVEVLETVFNKSRSEAYSLMMSVHKSDYAVVGIYTRDIAYTKASIAVEMARKAGYPLKVTAESV